MTNVSNLPLEDLKKLVTEKGSKKAAAEALDIHPSYLGELLNGTRDFSDNILEKLGYEKVVVHVKADRAPKIVKAIQTALELSRSR